MPNPRATFHVGGGVSGQFTVEVFLDQMPLTASNFLDLCHIGFYNGVHFHRVIPNFMCQFGCPHAKDPNSGRAGTGQPAGKSTFTKLDDKSLIARTARGAIDDEHTAQLSNKKGTLSMANAGPQSGGSQFFINVKHNKNLDWWTEPSGSKHPVFGEVVDGYDFVEKISKVPTTRDRPNDPIKCERVELSGVEMPASSVPLDQPPGEDGPAKKEGAAKSGGCCVAQ